MFAPRRAAAALAPAGILAALAACVDSSPAPTEPESRSAAVMPGGCPGPSLKVEDIQACVTLDAVRAHLLKFQEFSDIGGGDRTAWGGFYLLSSEYVLRQLQGAGYDVTRHALQAFTMIGFGPSTLERTAPSAQVYAGE